MTRTLIFHGDAWHASSIVQRLEEIGVKVEQRPARIARWYVNETSVDETVVDLVCTGTITLIGYAVWRLEGRFEGQLDVPADVESAVRVASQRRGFLP